MKLSRVAIFCLAPVALSFTALPAPALAQSPSSYERAILEGLDSATRREVQQRATAGNTVSGVVATKLLNNYQHAGPRTPGAAVTVVAVDFVRGAVVLREAPDVLVLERFDTATLNILRP